MSLPAFNHIDAGESDNDDDQCDIPLTDDAESRVQESFSFSRISNDSKTAFFRSSCSDALNQDFVFDCIDELSPDALNDASLIVQIRNYVHDIYIPDLKVHRSTKEISLDWKNLFSLFFAEEKTYGKIMQRWVSCSANLF